MPTTTATLQLPIDTLGKVEFEQNFAASMRLVDAAIGGKLLVGTAVYDPPSLADGANGPVQTISVPGVALGDYVDATSFSINTQGLTIHGWVSAADTVSYRFRNQTGATVDLGSGTVRVRIRKAA